MVRLVIKYKYLGRGLLGLIGLLHLYFGKKKEMLLGHALPYNVVKLANRSIVSTVRTNLSGKKQ
jgi:hypothetical protein